MKIIYILISNNQKRRELNHARNSVTKQMQAVYEG